MRSPQTGIFAIGTSAHGYLELDALPGVTAAELLGAVASLEEPHRTSGAVNLVVGVRPSLWRSVGECPSDLLDFVEPVVGADGFQMPATQHDLWVWVAGSARDIIWDLTRDIVDALREVAVVAEVADGWDYRHGRDLIGFVDGTENPSLLEAPPVVLIPDGQPGAGGAVLLTQRWTHDHETWRALPIEEQERVVGRTKLTDEELDEDSMPADSHVSRTVVEEADGTERAIFRRNTPIGALDRSGTIFIGFSNDQALLHLMLERMAGADGGPRDALTRYSTPETGSYYFCPSVEALAQWKPEGSDS